MKNQSSGIRVWLLLSISYIAFISLGLPDGLLGIAWPFMSGKFGKPLDALGILLIGFVAGYLTTSISSAKILTRIHLGLLLSFSCCITGISLLGFAFSGHWFLIIVSSFFLGSGGGAIDSSINTFAASRFSASAVNWLHAFYGIGATVGPLIMTWMLSHEQMWYNGYIVVGIIQIFLSLLFLFTMNYWKVSSDKVEHLPAANYSETLRMPIVWFGLLIFFLYVGLEIGVGQWIFTILTKSRNIPEEEAGLWTSAYWGSLTAGRILFGFILTRYSVHKILIVALTGIVMGTVLVVINQSNLLSLIGVVCIGMFNAPVFPCLISITPKRVGEKHAANVIGFQVSSSMIGGALLPGFAGLMTDYFGLEIIPKIYVAEAILLFILYFVSSRVPDPDVKDS